MLVTLALVAMSLAPALAQGAPTAAPHQPAASEAPGKKKITRASAPGANVPATRAKPDQPDAKAASKFEQQPVGLTYEDDAKGGAGGKGRDKGATGGAMWRMVLGLLFVLGVIYAVHWLLKNYSKSRFPGMVSSGGGAIEVVATTPLAANRSLHLVRVGTGVVLIGATDSSITQLGTLDAQQMLNDAGNAGNSEFQQLLQGAIGRGSTAAPGYSGSPPAGSGTASSAPDTFFRRFVANLQMMTAR